MKIKCPHCQREYAIDDAYKDQFVECEVCGKGFDATPISAATKTGDAAQNQTANISIHETQSHPPKTITKIIVVLSGALLLTNCISTAFVVVNFKDIPGALGPFVLSACIAGFLFAFGMIGFAYLISIIQQMEENIKK